MNEVTQEITLVTETRDCIIYSDFLGFHGEDNANKLVFTFADGFIDGIATLHLERGSEKGNITLDKVGETYELLVKNSLLTQVGEIKFQLSLATADNFFIFRDFIMHVDESIVSDSTIPEDYPTWIEIANQKIIDIDKEIAKSEELREQLLQDKENGVFNGKDGKDGEDYTLTEEDKKEIVDIAGIVGRNYYVDDEVKGETFNDYNYNKAPGKLSHSEGYRTRAIGDYSHSECWDTRAEGIGSHSEGVDTQALGNASHSEGIKTTAIGQYSHSEGQNTLAEGDNSHAEGYRSKATGSTSHAEGTETEAKGKNSHSEGYFTQAIGHHSHTEGMGTIALGKASHVQGKYNVLDNENKFAYIVGNGTSDKERSNAHTIDWDGNGWFAGDLTINGDQKVASEQYVLDLIGNINSELAKLTYVGGDE